MTDRMKRTDADKLQNEYEKLVQGLATANEHREDEDMMSSPGKLHRGFRSPYQLTVSSTVPRNAG
jgi:hypothetical protein